MTELTRQSWLKAMGFTAWVARRPLPGAAVSPELPWPDAPAETPVPVAEPAPLPETGRPVSVSAPAARETPAPTAPATPRRATGTAVTLLAYPAGDLWLLVQQARADAPEPGRQEQQLLASLLRLWRVKPQRPRRFATPAAGFDDRQTGEAVQAFVSALREHGARRLLCCMDETVAAMLHEGDRYQRVSVGGLDCLPVSSLAEMLADPVRHKKRTWQAMREAGFAP